MPLVYRDGRAPLATRAQLCALRRRAAEDVTRRNPDAALGLLIDVAEFESAVADALCPERDHTDALIDRLRTASCEAAHLWLACRDGSRPDPRPLEAALGALPDDALPTRAALPVSEGFAYYALFPETYAASARRLILERGWRDVCTLGLRNIGAALAAIASATLRAAGCRSSSLTVRPRGHPFARELRLDASLADVLRREAARGAAFAIVDEGPGISGSSFATAASALSRIGVPRDRIVLFPSWLPAAESLSSVDGRAAWSCHAKYWTSSEETGATPASAFGVTSSVIDFSAGRWRETLFADERDWPEIEPRHERVKAYLPSERRLLKFAGLGRYGAAALRRAHALADAGLAPRPGALRGGFIDLPFVDGTPLSWCEDLDTAGCVGEYIGRVAAIFPADDPADIGQLAEMVDVNARELLGREAPRPPREDVRAVEIDGRMLAHEWIRTRDGSLAKVDALDHHRDHFFPGVQSPAWDLAGAMIELGMTAAQSRALLERYEAASGDRAARRVLPYFRFAYAVFRAGYCAMAQLPAERYSQCALNAIACFSASSKSPRKQIARSSMNT